MGKIFKILLIIVMICIVACLVAMPILGMSAFTATEATAGAAASIGSVFAAIGGALGLSGATAVIGGALALLALCAIVYDLAFRGGKGVKKVAAAVGHTIGSLFKSVASSLGFKNIFLIGGAAFLIYLLWSSDGMRTKRIKNAQAKAEVSAHKLTQATNETEYDRILAEREQFARQQKASVKYRLNDGSTQTLETNHNDLAKAVSQLPKDAIIVSID